MRDGEARVLCVDLDGTLIAGDLLWESLLQLLRRNPWSAWRVLLWTTEGRAGLKRRLAQAAPPDVAALPYRQEVVDWLRQEARNGRRVVLASGADGTLVASVAGHLGFFDGWLGSDGNVNLTGRAKRDELVKRYGPAGFAYAGNSEADVPCWEAASGAVVVAASPATVRRVAERARIERSFPAPNRAAASLPAALRVRQWAKNLLLFAPLLLAHRAGDWKLLLLAFQAAIGFSLCASGVYVLNDLLDAPSDRLHPRKRSRPFAAGALPVPAGLLMAAILLTAGLALSLALLPRSFTLLLAAYAAASTCYSLRLKRIPVLDVMLLAGFYCVRLVAGGVATAVPLSAWTLAFALFLFLSLGVLKRYAELTMTGDWAANASRARGYTADDREWLAGVGLGSGLLSVLVLALYINSREVEALHRRPELLWAVCPLLLYWVIRLWFRARRREIADDPILVALTDPASWAVGALAVAAVWLAV